MQELTEVKQRLEKAEEQFRRNSQNSSQPPSQDRPGHQPVRQDDLSTEKRRRGGQQGHAGHQRSLVPVDQVDEIVGSDRASAYNWWDPSQRQVCWSHLLRDFQKILERGGESHRIRTNLKL